MSWLTSAVTTVAMESEANCIIQLKSDDLLQYPKGRSAMIWYGYGAIQPNIHKLQQCFPEPCLIRALPHVAAETEFERLLQRFTKRFGAPPKNQHRRNHPHSKKSNES